MVKSAKSHVTMAAIEAQPYKEYESREHGYLNDRHRYCTCEVSRDGLGTKISPQNCQFSALCEAISLKRVAQNVSLQNHETQSHQS